MTKPGSLGELFDLVEHDIPLHIAARCWSVGMKQRLATPDRMRWRTLLIQLAHYPITYDRVERQGVPLTRQTSLLVHPSRCARCNAVFVGSKTGQLHCGRSCASKTVREQVAARKHAA